ncbi:MAG: right-handed parallel beta-helix repeat-containing protein, partial [Planctomycetota bacterium]
SGDREATFQLKNDLTIKGGYAGFGEPDPDARDTRDYVTILSGDIGIAGDISDNSYRVVTGSGTETTAVLDGFTVTASCGERPDECGGVYSRFGSPTVANCTFIDNWALYGYSGNGMYNRYGNPTVTNCIFNGSGHNCGMLNSQSNPTITNCVFIRNRQCGIASYGGSLILTNCLFGDNDWAIFIDYCDPIIRNCTFSRNNRAIEYDGGATAALTNCIVWENTEPFYADTINYSCVQGSWDTGTGNITEDPLFVDASNGDYHLLEESPCIDTGDPNYLAEPNETDLDGRSRVIGGRIDMGAYELSMPPIEVPMKLVPQAINPSSKGKWVKANFVLPEGFSVEDVDTSRPAEIEQFHITSESMEVSVKDGLVSVVAVFDRSAFCSIGPFEGEIAVVGYLTSGQSFRGTDTIKIVRNKIKHLAVVVSKWLAVCSSPDWCDGADLDQDSVVNFVDVALVDGCCFEVITD